MKMPKGKQGFQKGNNFGTQFKIGDNLGRSPWNKGKKMSEEFKNKISKAEKGYTHGIKNLIPLKKGCIPWNKGKKNCFSEETLEKISQAQKGKIVSLETKKKISIANKGKKMVKRAAVLGAKAASNKYPTSIEKKVYSELIKRGFLFEKQKLINGKFLVDAYIPKLNLVIEADGDYWHSLDRVKKRDKAKNAYLAKCGYNLLRISETEINNGKFMIKLPN